MAAEAEGKEAMAGTTAGTAAAANIQTAAVWVMTQMVMPQMATMPETEGGRLKKTSANRRKKAGPNLKLLRTISGGPMLYGMNLRIRILENTEMSVLPI